MQTCVLERVDRLFGDCPYAAKAGWILAQDEARCLPWAGTAGVAHSLKSSPPSLRRWNSERRDTVVVAESGVAVIKQAAGSFAKENVLPILL